MAPVRQAGVNLVQASQRYGLTAQGTTGQGGHLQGVQVRSIARRCRSRRMHNRPVSQLLVPNNGWQMGDNNAPNVTWPNAILNNGDLGIQRMCHNGGFCPNGNPCPGNPTATAAHDGQSQDPVDNRDLRGNGPAEPTQQLETPEDVHIRNILEHTRMHRDGILQRLNDNSDINRLILILLRAKT